MMPSVVAVLTSEITGAGFLALVFWPWCTKVICARPTRGLLIPLQVKLVVTQI